MKWFFITFLTIAMQLLFFLILILKADAFPKGEIGIKIEDFLNKYNFFITNSIKEGKGAIEDDYKKIGAIGIVQIGEIKCFLIYIDYDYGKYFVFSCEPTDIDKVFDYFFENGNEMIEFKIINKNQIGTKSWYMASYE